MSNSTQSLALSAPAAGQADHDTLRCAMDEDVALGCECADPALQIDCWAQEAAKPMQQPD